MEDKTLKNLILLRQEKNQSMTDVANSIGMSVQRYSNYEKGTRQADYDTLNSLSKHFNVSIDYLLGNKDDKTSINNNVATLPIKFLGNASCGEGVHNFPENEFFDIPISWVISDISDYYLVRAVGDSMIGANIQDNSILVVRHQNTLENGQIGVFTLNDEQYIKKIKIYENHIELVSANNKYDNITVTNNDNFIINGLVLKEITTLEKEI